MQKAAAFSVRAVGARWLRPAQHCVSRRLLCTQHMQTLNAAEEGTTEAQDQQPSDSQSRQHPALRIQELEASLHKMQEERDDLKNRYLRTLADIENVRRVSKSDLDNAHKFANSKFAASMLEVADTLELALQAVKPEQVEGDRNPELKSFYEGVEMTERVLAKALEQHSVVKFNPKGEKFDPFFHEALFQMDDPNQEPNTVAQVIKTGYLIGDRVLRAAKVGTVRPRPQSE